MYFIVLYFWNWSQPKRIKMVKLLYHFSSKNFERLSSEFRDFDQSQITLECVCSLCLWTLIILLWIA